MGRAYRYQRRLSHLIVSVAERNGGSSLVTRVDEPETSGKKSAPKKTAAKKTAAKKAPAKKASAKKAATKKSASAAPKAKKAAK
jgi:large subunit ribosomal protein L22